MTSALDASADPKTNAAALAPNVDSSSITDSPVQATIREPLFPADLIEECLQEYIWDNTLLEPGSILHKRCSQPKCRIQSLNAERIIENDISDCWSTRSADSEYFSESALFTDGGLNRTMKGPKADNGNRGRVYTVHLVSGESSSSEDADESSLSDDVGEESEDSSSGDPCSDGDQSGKESSEHGHGDGEGPDRETIPYVSGVAASDDERSASDDGYHVDYDDDDNEIPVADFFDDAEGDLGRYPTNAAFNGHDGFTDGYDTDYDDEWDFRTTRCDSPNIDEHNQRINEYLWSTI